MPNSPRQTRPWTRSDAKRPTAKRALAGVVGIDLVGLTHREKNPSARRDLTAGRGALRFDKPQIRRNRRAIREGRPVRDGTPRQKKTRHRHHGRKQHRATMGEGCEQRVIHLGYLRYLLFRWLRGGRGLPLFVPQNADQSIFRAGNPSKPLKAKHSTPSSRSSRSMSSAWHQPPPGGPSSCGPCASGPQLLSR